MRTITQYSEHIYATKSSAMRAARKAVGHKYAVDVPELRNRFFGDIKITGEMINVEPVEGGWRWSYTYNLADVLVDVRGEDQSLKEVRYADACHWQDASTPPPASSKPDQAPPTETDTPASAVSPVVGKIHPKGQLFFRIHVGTATGGGYSFELAFDSGSCTPLILCEDTGKTYELPWRDILTLAVAAGVTKADAPKSSGRETA